MTIYAERFSEDRPETGMLVCGTREIEVIATREEAETMARKIEQVFDTPCEIRPPTFGGEPTWSIYVPSQNRLVTRPSEWAAQSTMEKGETT